MSVPAYPPTAAELERRELTARFEALTTEQKSAVAHWVIGYMTESFRVGDAVMPEYVLRCGIADVEGRKP